MVDPWGMGPSGQDFADFSEKLRGIKNILVRFFWAGGRTNGMLYLFYLHIFSIETKMEICQAYIMLKNFRCSLLHC